MLADLTSLTAAILDGQIAEHRQQGVELKSSWAPENGKKIAGLANRFGDAKRWLLVGVDDAGAVTGQTEKWARHTEQSVSQQINQFLDPVHACASINCIELPAGWVIVLEIVNPGVVARWNHKPYKMPGSTVLEMTPEEALELTLKLPGRTDYSKQAWTGALSPDLSAVFGCILEAADASEPLEQLGLSGRQAGRILLGDCGFRVVWFDENEDVVRNETHHGLVRLLSPEVRERIQAWARPQEGGEAPFPELVLKETLANAVAHAAYFDRDGDVIVEVHRDRLVTSNLCVPQAGLFANKWFSRAHWTLNALLMEVLRAARIVDELGRGKQVIFRESLLAGRRQPIVDVDPAGQVNRWRLTVFGGSADERQKRLTERLLDIYDGSRQKALVAQALILWTGEPIDKIRGYMDGESQKVLTDVLEHPRCPVLYGNDELQRARWVRILLEEGKDSKALSATEEEAIIRRVYQAARRNRGVFTTSQFREVAGLADSGSERTQANNVLKKWIKHGYVERDVVGKYTFRAPPPHATATAQDLVRRVVEALLDAKRDPQLRIDYGASQQ